jgi:hypothetical protein
MMAEITIGIPGIFEGSFDVTPRFMFLIASFTCFSFVLASLNQYGILPKSWYTYIYVFTFPFSIMISIFNALMAPLANYGAAQSGNITYRGGIETGCYSHLLQIDCPASGKEGFLGTLWRQFTSVFKPGPQSGWLIPWQCKGHEGSTITYDPCAIEPAANNANGGFS